MRCRRRLRVWDSPPHRDWGGTLHSTGIKGFRAYLIFKPGRDLVRDTTPQRLLHYYDAEPEWQSLAGQPPSHDQLHRRRGRALDHQFATGTCPAALPPLLISPEVRLRPAKVVAFTTGRGQDVIFHSALAMASRISTWQVGGKEHCIGALDNRSHFEVIHVSRFPFSRTSRASWPFRLAYTHDRLSICRRVPAELCS